MNTIITKFLCLHGSNMPRPAVDRERLKALFEQLDINKDGTIDVNEIQKGLSKLGINKPGEAEVNMNDIDR